MTIYKVWNPIEKFYIVELGRFKIWVGDKFKIDFRSYPIGIDALNYAGYYVNFWNFKRRLEGHYEPQQPITKREATRREYRKRIDYTKGGKHETKTT